MRLNSSMSKFLFYTGLILTLKDTQKKLFNVQYLFKEIFHSRFDQINGVSFQRSEILLTYFMLVWWYPHNVGNFEITNCATQRIQENCRFWLLFRRIPCVTKTELIKFPLIYSVAFQFSKNCDEYFSGSLWINEPL